MRNGPYTLIVAPEEYPGKKYRNRYAYEHHVIYWRHYKALPVGLKQIVHHKNKDTRDNRIENLELISSAAHHGYHHKKASICRCKCGHCGSLFDIPKSEYKRRKKASLTGLFCGRSCQVSAQMLLRWDNIRSIRSIPASEN